MSVAKILARKILIPVSLKLNIDKLLLKKSKNGCVIINFHGVRRATKHTINNRHIPVNEFEKIVSYLTHNFEVVSLSKIFEMKRQGIKPTKKTVALTFDDGYLNNFEVALPVLRKYKAPATFYIITKCLVDDNFHAWPDEIDVVKARANHFVHFENLRYELPNLFSPVKKTDLVTYLKTLGSRTIAAANSILYQVPEYEKEFERSHELLKLITRSEIEKYIADPLLEFGSHSHSHPNMEFLSASECVEELRTSAQLLAEVTGKKPLSIAYPDGSYSAETLRLSREHGYEILLAVEYRHPDRDKKDPDLMNRFTVSNSTTAGSNILRLAKSFSKYAS